MTEQQYGRSLGPLHQGADQSTQLLLGFSVNVYLNDYPIPSKKHPYTYTVFISFTEFVIYSYICLCLLTVHL